MVLSIMITTKLARIYRKSAQTIVGSACRYCSGKQERKHWRTPWNERSGEWFSNLSVFQTSRGPSMDWLTLVQTDIDLWPSTVKRWWKSGLERLEIAEECFIPERHQILGGDLAAAHFIVHRGGRVRFFGQENWVHQDENEEYNLPKFYDPSYCIEAIDASKMRIHFEGVGNLLDLHKIKWLSFEGCPNIDDWCIDRISGAYQDSLNYLDIRNCPKLTYRGLSALYRMRNLQTLLLSNDASDRNIEVMCLMLEDILPKLQIEGVTYLSIPDSAEPPEKKDSVK